MNKSMNVCGLLLALLCWACWSATPARADLFDFDSSAALSQQQIVLTVPPQKTDFTVPLSVPVFNSALGTLVEVRIFETVSLNGSAGYQNQAEVTSTITLKLSARTVLQVDGSLMVAEPLINAVVTAPPGSSAILPPAMVSVDKSLVVNSASELPHFVGSTGQFITFTFTATGTSKATDNTGNVFVQFNTTAGTVVTVVYVFRPNVQVNQPAVMLQKTVLARRIHRNNNNNKKDNKKDQKPGIGGPPILPPKKDDRSQNSNNFPRNDHNNKNKDNQRGPFYPTLGSFSMSSPSAGPAPAPAQADSTDASAPTAPAAPAPANPSPSQTDSAGPATADASSPAAPAMPAQADSAPATPAAPATAAVPSTGDKKQGGDQADRQADSTEASAAAAATDSSHNSDTGDNGAGEEDAADATGADATGDEDQVGESLGGASWDFWGGDYHDNQGNGRNNQDFDDDRHNINQEPRCPGEKVLVIELERDDHLFDDQRDLGSQGPFPGKDGGYGPGIGGGPLDPNNKDGKNDHNNNNKNDHNNNKKNEPDFILVTYCFRVTNIGNTFLFPITLIDETAKQNKRIIVDRGTPSLPLAPNDDVTFQLKNVKIKRTTRNTATVIAVPSDAAGNSLGLPAVRDTDSALVIIKQRQRDDNNKNDNKQDHGKPFPGPGQGGYM